MTRGAEAGTPKAVGPGLGALMREIAVSAWAQRVSTVVTVLIIGGSALTILLTSGRSAAAEAAVLASIDAQGTRAVTIAAKGEDAGLARSIVDDLARLHEVEDVVGLGPVQDLTAAAIPEGSRVGARTAYGRLRGDRLEQTPATLGLGAWVTHRAGESLGMPSGAGAVRFVDGEELFITKQTVLPDYLIGLEPAVLVPVARNDEDARFSTIVVLARDPSQVSLVSDFARSLLVDLPREGVTVSTSEQMAELRRVVGGQLTAQGRAIVLGVLGGAMLATVVNVWGLTLLRRRDIGRRRALGATRATIIALMVGQVAVAAAGAAMVGAGVGVGLLARGDAPAPGLEYTAAVILALTGIAAIAAAVPASIASRRDPLTELRVP